MADETRINDRLAERIAKFVDHVAENYSFGRYTMDMGIFDLEVNNDTDVRRIGREYGFKFLIERITRIENTFKRYPEITDDDIKDIFYKVMARLFNVDKIEGDIKAKLDIAYPKWVDIAKKFAESRERVREERRKVFEKGNN